MTNKGEQNFKVEKLYDFVKFKMMKSIQKYVSRERNVRTIPRLFIESKFLISSRKMFLKNRLMKTTLFYFHPPAIL